MRSGEQQALFSEPQALPAGCCYRSDFLSEEEEAELLGYFEDLPFEHSRLGEYAAKRRVVSFGWGYDFRKECLMPGPPLPPFLTPLKRKVAKWLDIPTRCVVEALITEYPKGAAIGWHKDNEKFEAIVGVSLAGSCRLRLRPTRHQGRQQTKDVFVLALPPRSAYALQKESRWDYQHSIPAVPNLRYSITFRTLPPDIL